MAETVLTSPDRLSNLEDRLEDLTKSVDENTDELKKITGALSRLQGLGGIGSLLGNLFSQPARAAPRVRRR